MHIEQNRAVTNLSAEALKHFVDLSNRERKNPAYDISCRGPFEIVARHGGRRIFTAWFENSAPFRMIESVLAAAQTAELLQLYVTTDKRRVEPSQCAKILSLTNSGRLGAEAAYKGVVDRLSPLQTIASNRPLHKWFSGVLQKRGITQQEFFANGGQLNVLQGLQFLVGCTKRLPAVETFRGNTIVSAATPAEELCSTVLRGAARWFQANLSLEGEIPYKYWPSRNEYSTSDNPIRRFMATIALNRLSIHLGSRELRNAAKRNLEYNISRFFKFEGDVGIIEWDGSVKLGALALAALAMLESPFSQQWTSQLGSLERAINGLWQPTGAFRTFWRPVERNDNQNFYPGEALLFWTSLLRLRQDKALLHRIERSIVFYREEFRRDPNPAFVPWHTQAATALFEITGDQQLPGYIFEMNDWLLEHQQWGGVLDPDLWGRFYSPDKPYGPPHASSTGVYLEGLVDALAVASALGDERRSIDYRRAVHRGMRSIAQLQFKDRLDAFYVKKIDAVLGAVRTETYNNEIRVDNIQHPTMALLKFKTLDSQIRKLSKRTAMS
jgi:hypothetical protein